MHMKKPLKVAVSGAAGQIGYSLVFRIASGEMLGKDQPVVLHLLDLPDEKTQAKLKGVMMELDDCAFPLLTDIKGFTDSRDAFKEVSYALLVGAYPRGPGMERKDLLSANAQIFKDQGKALNEGACRDVKVVVVGNPANTNAYIAMRSARDLSSENFTALLRLDHNRAIHQLADKLSQPVAAFEKVCVWGNHSSTMYADYRFATVHGQSVKEAISDHSWYEDSFLPVVAKRGTAIIEARGLSSAASAAHATLEHVRDWVLGSDQKWVTMGVPSRGEYGIPEGIVFGYPVTTDDGNYQVVKGLEMDGFSKERMAITLKELLDEIKSIEPLL